ncbi:SMC-Scp complex subunit ScpB [Cellvibrio sp. UBA7671]|uniref:SMC-Scp complex subunit ScpB n=1 Tax=Cellvibrio sp. UBA7671 TaxID=1946312 RepID=UPI002F353AD2
MTNEIDIAEDTLDEDLDSSTEVGEEAGEESRALHEESDTEESATVPVTQMPVDAELLRKIIEGAILAAGQPMTIARLLELFDEEVAPSKDEIAAALLDIQAASAERGFELKEVASGWRFQVRDNLAPWVNRLWEEKPQKYSRALLETLALVAYRQPITRGDIEEIRGVAVSSHIMKTLLERDWVKVVGHRDVPGRPSLFATTRQFLDYFNLKSLEELPSLSEIRDLDELNPVLDLGEAGLGEKDTDPPIPDENPPVATSEVDAEPVDTQAAFYEEGFVDGEDAFVDVEEDAAAADTSDTEAINNEEEPRSD